jgi:hypothetical protein
VTCDPIVKVWLCTQIDHVQMIQSLRYKFMSDLSSPASESRVVRPGLFGPKIRSLLQLTLCISESHLRIIFAVRPFITGSSRASLGADPASKLLGSSGRCLVGSQASFLKATYLNIQWPSRYTSPQRGKNADNDLPMIRFDRRKCLARR